MDDRDRIAALQSALLVIRNAARQGNAEQPLAELIEAVVKRATGLE